MILLNVFIKQEDDEVQIFYNGWEMDNPTEEEKKMAKVFDRIIESVYENSGD